MTFFSLAKCGADFVLTSLAHLAMLRVIRMNPMDAPRGNKKAGPQSILRSGFGSQWTLQS